MFGNDNFEFIEKTREDFSDKYHALNGKIKKRLVSKKYFTGSRDPAGYYEPCLTDRLLDKMARRGRFVKSRPAEGSFFEYWYGENGENIKMKYISDGDVTDCYDVIPIRQGSEQLHLYYGYDLDGEITLTHIDRMYRDEKDRLTAFRRYIYSIALKKYDIEEHEYTYTGENLLTADICDGYRSLHFDFFYGGDGYLDRYVTDDGRHKCETAADPKVTARFEKSGIYCFSPEGKG